MIAWVVLAVALPLAACYLALRAIADEDRRADVALAAALGLGLSTGLSAWTYFAALLVTGRHASAVWLDTAFWVVALALVALTAAARAKRRSVSSTVSAPPDLPLAVAPWAAYAAAAGFASLAVLAAITLWWGWQTAPHGNWDALAIWNLRARAILRGAPNWRDILSPEIGWSHPSYPPLLPLSIARLWAYGGREALVVPQIVATTFFVASTLTLVAALSKLRGWHVAFVGGSCLLVPIVFVDTVVGQDADVPFGFFVVAALSLLALAQRARRFSMPILVATGMVTGLAAWTKDEGLLLLVLIPMLTAIFPGASSRRGAVAWLAGGAAPFVLTLIWFKLRLAPPSYLIAGQTPFAILNKLRDVDRLHYIGQQVTARISTWGPGVVPAVPALGAATVLMGRIDRAGAKRAALSLALALGMLSGDVLAYMISPLDVAWQIVTSFDRLVLQLWPILVWGAFQLTGRETAIQPDPERGTVL